MNAASGLTGNQHVNEFPSAEIVLLLDESPEVSDLGFDELLHLVFRQFGVQLRCREVVAKYGQQEVLGSFLAIVYHNSHSEPIEEDAILSGPWHLLAMECLKMAQLIDHIPHGRLNGHQRRVEDLAEACEVDDIAGRRIVVHERALGRGIHENIDPDVAA